MFNELIDFALQTVRHFGELKEEISVKTVYGTNVKPSVSPYNHMYLQPKALNKIIDAIKQPIEILRNVTEIK